MTPLAKIKTIPDFLTQSAHVNPKKIGLIFENASFSYEHIQKEADRVARFVIQYTKKGDVVALLLPNTPRFIFSYFGVLQAGCITQIVPTAISDHNFAFQINKTQPKILISDQTHIPKIRRLSSVFKPPYYDIDTLAKTSGPAQRRAIGDDVSTIMFTSGSTSQPKGALLRHKNVVSATDNIMDYLNWQKSDIDINISSLSHSFGLGHLHCSFAASSTTILFRDAINLRKILQGMEKYRATTFGAVPAVLRLLCQNFGTEFARCGSSLRFVQTNTSPLETQLIETVQKLLPQADFHFYYGLTEASRSTFITFNRTPKKINSVGQPLKGVGIKIVGPRGKILISGNIGEICIKGPHVIKKYWQDNKAGKRIKHKWLHTGDMGFLDDDGFLFFVGRKDDLINVSGEKFRPDEIENVVKKITGIVDAAAIGVDDLTLGQVVKVFVQTREPDFDIRLIISACRKNLESYKVPRLVQIVDQIPRTENGKLMRNQLKNL